MTDVEGFAAELRKRIREDLNTVADQMANGGAADFPAYKQLVGTITGLGLAERHLLDLLEKVKDADE